MMVMSQTQFVVIYEAADGRTFIRPANGIWGVKSALEGVVDFRTVKMDDGGYVTVCGGRVSIVGNGCGQVIQSLRKGISQSAFC